MHMNYTISFYYMIIRLENETYEFKKRQLQHLTYSNYIKNKLFFIQLIIKLNLLNSIC